MTPARLAPILFAEEEEISRKKISQYLSMQGYYVVQTQEGAETLEKYEKNKAFEAAIISDMLPGKNGCAVCSEIRKKSLIPIIMLTNSNSDKEQYACYQSGADVCLKKPVNLEILSVRLQALLHRSGVNFQQRISLGGLTLDRGKYEFSLDGNKISLTPREFNLLYYLVSHKNIVVPREKILGAVWGKSYIGNERTIDTHIKCLRKKLEDYQNCLVTFRKVGYEFQWKQNALKKE